MLSRNFIMMALLATYLLSMAEVLSERLNERPTKATAPVSDDPAMTIFPSSCPRLSVLGAVSNAAILLFYIWSAPTVPLKQEPQSSLPPPQTQREHSPQPARPLSRQ